MIQEIQEVFEDIFKVVNARNITLAIIVALVTLGSAHALVAYKKYEKTVRAI